MKLEKLRWIILTGKYVNIQNDQIIAQKYEYKILKIYSYKYIKIYLVITSRLTLSFKNSGNFIFYLSTMLFTILYSYFRAIIWSFCKSSPIRATPSIPPSFTPVEIGSTSSYSSISHHPPEATVATPSSHRKHSTATNLTPLEVQIASVRNTIERIRRERAARNCSAHESLTDPFHLPSAQMEPLSILTPIPLDYTMGTINFTSYQL